MQATAQAQPNIALIKYWGKRDIARNLPAAGSISITLDSLWTRMTVEFGDYSGDKLEVNGSESIDMLPRVSSCLNDVAGLDRPAAMVRSDCNFPIAAGLASSASAFAALVIAADKAAMFSNDRSTLTGFAGKASGSAARSMFEGFAELSVDDDGIDVHTLVPAGDWRLEVVVAVTESNAKPVTSGEAMQRCMEGSPFYRSWIDGQPADLGEARDAILSRDFAKLAAVSEHNCLKMHAVMWGARPAVVFWNQATLAAMQTIRQLQDDEIPVFFTIDAGPQLKAICLAEATDSVRAALDQTDGVLRTMRSSLGKGARLVEDS